MIGLADYHYIWLHAHPERSEAWLRVKLADGFDIHHLDCDRKNNGPDNLVLIEHADHMRLHGRSMRRLIGEARHRKTKSDEAVGRTCYDLRAAERLPWKEIDAQFGLPQWGSQSRARNHAKANGLPWPLRRAERPGPSIQTFNVERSSS